MSLFTEALPQRRGWSVYEDQQRDAGRKDLVTSTSNGKSIQEFIAKLNAFKKPDSVAIERRDPMVSRYFPDANSTSRELNKKRMKEQDELFTPFILDGLRRGLTPSEQENPHLLFIELGVGNWPNLEGMTQFIRGSFVGLELDPETFRDTEKRLKDIEGLDLSRVRLIQEDFTKIDVLEQLAKEHREKHGPDAPIVIYASLALVHLLETDALPFLKKVMEMYNIKFIARNANLKTMVEAIDYQTDTQPNPYHVSMQKSVDLLKGGHRLADTTETIVHYFSQLGGFDISFIASEVHKIDTSLLSGETPRTDAEKEWHNLTTGILIMLHQMAQGKFNKEMESLEADKSPEWKEVRMTLILNELRAQYYIPVIVQLSENGRRGSYLIEQFTIQARKATESQAK